MAVCQMMSAGFIHKTFTYLIVKEVCKNLLDIFDSAVFYEHVCLKCKHLQQQIYCKQMKVTQCLLSPSVLFIYVLLLILILGTFPIDLTKTRLQVQGQSQYTEVRYRGMFHALFRIGKEEGVRALYSGYPTMSC